MTRAIVIPVEGLPRVDDIDTDLETLKALVGGWLEGIGGPGGWHGYCDEEGKLKALPVNSTACLICWGLGWPPGDVLCGPVVLLGDSADGEEADIPMHIVDRVERLLAGTK